MIIYSYSNIKVFKRSYVKHQMQKKLIAFFVLSIVLNVQADDHTYQHIQLVTYNKIGVKP